MGGTYGSKSETLDRFRTNYARLSDSIKMRLVLENDDVSWSVHDLLPICQELNIPLVLDFHHHNIIFSSEHVREGTEDLVPLFPTIRETWTRKRITQKMHYSEQTPAAITGMQRRKHSPRVATLPPCSSDMDLMIEAKDKEQAVFELMRTFKLDGYHLFNNMIPHARDDENPTATARKKVQEVKDPVPEEEVGMGGPLGRVYWPPGMEEWLRPKKREVKPKAEGTPKSKKPKMTKELPTPSVNGISDSKPPKPVIDDVPASIESLEPVGAKPKKRRTAQKNKVAAPALASGTRRQTRKARVNYQETETED